MSQLLTVYTEWNTHIEIIGVDINECAISLPKLADWGPNLSQPMGLIEVILMKSARAPTFGTNIVLLIES